MLYDPIIKDYTYHRTLGFHCYDELLTLID